jgi:hypothetical protein
MLDDREETRKIATHPDPFEVNQNRHSSNILKSKKILDLRNSLYQS